jgi:DNA-binding PadR family transcriptional regulator
MRKNCSKVVIENFFEPCLLYLLSEKPGYGYELKGDLAERCGCAINVANLYNCLASLTKKGCVKKKKTAGDGGPDRVTYTITAKGKKLLASWIGELEEEMKTVKKLITNYKKLYADDK